MPKLNIDEQWLLNLVDIVWNEATESQAVPSTKWAKEMLTKAVFYQNQSPKQYFAKYLPVEGEITDHECLFISKDGKIHECRNIFESLPAQIEDEDGLMHSEDDVKLVKLFLCSRDIQVGDKYIDSNGDTLIHSTGILEPTDYKVIGEISPEATFATEGMKFDEDEVEAKYNDGMSTLDISDDFPFEYKLSYYRIKGPCGHFH